MKRMMILQSPDCPLFKLPGELRTRIYEMVFEDPDESKVVDVARDFPHIATTLAAMRNEHFFQIIFGSVGALIFYENSSLSGVSPGLSELPPSAAPSAALLLTCQMIHAEARVIFVEAYRRYCENDFFINLQDISNKHELAAYLDVAPTDFTSTFNLSIPHVRVAFSFRKNPPIKVTLSRKKGGQWRATATPGTHADIDARNGVLNVLNSHLQRLR